MDNYYTSLENFILGKDYDVAADCLIKIVCAAFRAGYTAAGGEAPMPRDDRNFDEIADSSKEISIERYLKRDKEK